MIETTQTLPSQAELRAAESQSIIAFKALNLLNIRSSVTELLAQIGRNGLFQEYTLHDISHIDKLLKTLEWLVPDTTKRVMTPADWLMIVLAVYFHDLGMVITKQEFEARMGSEYQDFKNSVYRGKDGPDYQAKIALFGSVDERERFLYQEFVRQHHAQRIKLWISGQDAARFGVAAATAAEVRKLVHPLGEKFCRDLALVCESHHSDDLFDLKKYKPSQPYGDDPKEVINLQYAAILLRTTDLLHVTRDRTPSLTFRLVNPTDPISVEEWHKQMAVVSVRSQVAVDKEGNASTSLPRDTVEIHANFDSPEGFFALTSYLQYVRSEFKKCYDWAKLGFKQSGIPYDFPWRYIDDSNVETHGFLSKQFEFTLDQAKILDLLTGHTLYNDISVVLRELVQNSIDAIRLEASETEASPGVVTIKWNTAERSLVVTDTGTGMSQRTIEDHLLKAGSSLYQDPEFKKKHPAFSPISRFGIGVLSAFMIADEVEIVTCHPDDEHARHLTLRSVHGRYLVKLLSKQELPAKLQVSKHGTVISLKVRPSVQMPSVLETARRWVVVPGCDVFVSVDEAAAVKVGFGSVKESVEAYCHDIGYRTVTTVESTINNVDVAIALRWNDSFQEWEFVAPPSRDREDVELAPLGLCVEGIRVTFGTPGYTKYPVIAIANARGSSAPRTNVARSGLELTPQRDMALSAVYEAFCSHIIRETSQLHGERKFSLTWATKEAKVLISAIDGAGRDNQAEDDSLLLKELSKIPALLIEVDRERKAISASELSSFAHIWTVDCPLFDSAEAVLREVPGSSSLHALSTALFDGSLKLESDPILAAFQPNHTVDNAALVGREVSQITLDQAQRRVDLLWTRIVSEPKWRILRENPRLGRGVYRMRGFDDQIYICMESIPIEVVTGKLPMGVRAFGRIYIFPHAPFAKCTIQYLSAKIPPRSRSAAAWLLISLLETGSGKPQRISSALVDKYVSKALSATPYDRSDFESLDLKPIQLMCEEETWEVFNPQAWIRKPPQGVEIDF